MWVGGEPFLLKPVLEFIDNYDPEKWPKMGFCATTNGTLIGEELQEKLKRFPRVRLTFSIDGITKEVYEKIRRGAKWEVTERNLRLAAENSKTNPWFVLISYIIMKSSFKDIPKAVELAFDLNVGICFGHVAGDQLRDENIFTYKELLRDIGDWEKILAEALDIAEKNRERNPNIANGIRSALGYIETLLRREAPVT